jgi:hypothetical protein
MTARNLKQLTGHFSTIGKGRLGIVFSELSAFTDAIKSDERQPALN